MRLWKLIALTSVLALALAACGGGDTTDTTDETAPPTEMTDTAEETEAADGGEDVEAASIVVENWDAYMPEDLPERIKEEENIDVEIALHATNEEAVAKMQATGGEGIDVLFVSSPFAEALDKQGLLAEIDHEQIPNLENLYPEAMELDYDTGLTYSVPYAWGTTGLCYQSDRVEQEPTSWDVLLDPPSSLEGKVTMLATDRWLLLPALKSLGYSANTTDEQELQEAKEILLDTKPQLLGYDDTTFYSKLVSGEADLVEAWDGWCNYGIAEDDAIKFVVPEEGADHWIDTMVIPAASENQEAAHRFINFILEPENGQWVAENILYKVPNRAAMEALDESLFETYPNLGMSVSDLTQYEELRDLGDGQQLWSRIVTEITAS